MVRSFSYWNLLLIAVISIEIAYGQLPTTRDKSCTKLARGQRKTIKDKMRDIKTITCAKTNNGVYRWKFVDGSPSVGEKFDPAEDCSDIVDNLPHARNGFYWIRLGGNRITKVWCDVHTDGGGFMLIGKKNSPTTWTVPSNPTPVDPKGAPHWSSVFGRVKVLDFAIQVSTSKRFEGTRAHWLYRLSPRRQLRKLFGVAKGGCTDVHSGIGNVAYVKDILTGNVVTRKFNCSKFGPHVDASLGWGRMNYCFDHKCPMGYAFISKIPIKLDSFGSFSYSATSSLSGITHDATAFVGCDKQKCCACYGPKGGRKNYCGPACTAINGGTVTKQAFVWSWIRTRMPRRVWKRCMEFKRKTVKGNLETYFIDRKTGSTHKGSCSNEFYALLNEGTLSLPDKESLDKLPSVPGLISYRKDNKKVYVNEGSQWEALSTEKEVEKLKTTLQQLQNRLQGKTIGGVVYTRWGSKTCPKTSKIVYSGAMAGSYYTHSSTWYQMYCSRQRLSSYAKCFMMTT